MPEEKLSEEELKEIERNASVSVDGCDQILVAHPDIPILLSHVRAQEKEIKKLRRWHRTGHCVKCGRHFSIQTHCSDCVYVPGQPPKPSKPEEILPPNICPEADTCTAWYSEIKICSVMGQCPRGQDETKYQNHAQTKNEKE